MIWKLSSEELPPLNAPLMAAWKQSGEPSLLIANSYRDSGGFWREEHRRLSRVQAPHKWCLYSDLMQEIEKP